MNKEYDIISLIELYLGKLWILILAAIVFAAGAFSYTKFVMPLQYTSSVALYAKNTDGTVAASNINQSDLNASQSLVETCIVILKEPPIMDQLASKLLETYSIDELSQYFSTTESDGKKKILGSSIGQCISMSSNNGVMKISARTTSPTLSADICNAMAAVAPDVLMRVVKAGSVETIGEATKPLAPSAPSKTQNAAIGGLIGFVLATLIILIADFFDRTIIESESFSKSTNIPVIGEIMAIDEDSTNKKHKRNSKKKSKQETTDEDKGRLLLNKSIPFYVKEAFKTLRTNLIFSLATKENRIIGISSANPNEGKSNISANLAITISQTESKVLLIDCDMRKPTQHKLFSLKNKMGLSNVISNMCTFDAAVNKNVCNNLDILTSGPTPPNPSEMLSSEKMAELLKKATEKYDYVIIDTPPINVVSDALTMSHLLAGLVMVVKAGCTTYDDVAKSMNSMELANIKPLGYVFAGKRVAESRFSKYNYKYKYYSYKKDYTYTYESDNEKLATGKKKINVS